MLRFWCLIFPLLLPLLAGGCANSTSADDRALIDQSARFNEALAPAVIDQPYIQALGQRLLTAGLALHGAHVGPPAHFQDASDWMFGPTMRFHLVDSPTSSAFTSGGQHVYMFTGLLRQCSSEDEVAALLAHEYAHVYCRSAIRRPSPPPADAALTNMVIWFVEHRFTPADEAEADEIAFRLYVRGGWNPARFASVFVKIGAPPQRLAPMKGWVDALPPVSADWILPPNADDRRFAARRVEALAEAEQRKVADGLARLITALPNCVLGEDSADQRRAQQELLTPPAIDTPGAFQKGFGPR